MTTFADLEFEVLREAPRFSDGEIMQHRQALVFFPNGYGASVINGPYSYGGENGLYEVAVLAGTREHYRICYETPITRDVIGHLSEDEVTKILWKIRALKTNLEALPAAEARHDAMLRSIKEWSKSRGNHHDGI